MQINNSNYADIEFKEVFCAKKYPFSEYTLNVTVLANSIISGVANGILFSREKLLGLLEEHSTMGNVTAQERLYSFLKKPIGKIDLTNPEKAAELLEKALKQERMWAIKEKINELVIAGKSKSFGIVRYHIMAAHQGDIDSINALKTLFGDKITYSRRLNCSPRMIEKEFSIKKYMESGFGSSTWPAKNKPWTTYGYPLNRIGKDFLSLYNQSGNNEAFQFAKAYLEKATELGDKEAIIALGCLYKEKSDFKSALYWYTKAASEYENSKQALYKAGLLEIKEFHGHPPDLQSALSFFLRAAELGCTASMNKAALYEYFGFDGHAPNEEKALELWKVSAHMGDAEAMFALGTLEEKLYHAKKSPTLDKALFWFEKSANEGFALAALSAALIENQDYSGHKRNTLATLKWCTIAAKKGNTESMLLAGNVEASNENYEKAREWYRLAVNAKEMRGMTALAQLEMYDFNNLNKARYWFNLAVNEGDFEAMFKLATLDMNLNQARALDLFVKAANLGHAKAMTNAGVMELRGFKGHPANPQKALEWFLKAAEKGDATGIFNASQLLLRLNDPSKMKDVMFWLNKACDLEYTPAIHCLDAMKNHKEKNDEELLKIHKDAMPYEEDFSDIISLHSKKSDADIVIIKEPSIFKQDDPIEVSPHEEENWEDALSDELIGYFDFSKYQQTEVDASIIRSHYQKIDEISHKISTFTISLDNLSSKNKLIWDSLNDSNATVTLSELIHFANDEVFDGQFLHCPTTSGIIFCFSHQKRYGTVSTHRKHNKSYKGVDRNFAREFRDMVRNVLSLEG